MAPPNYNNMLVSYLDAHHQSQSQLPGLLYHSDSHAHFLPLHSDNFSSAFELCDLTALSKNQLCSCAPEPSTSMKGAASDNVSTYPSPPSSESSSSVPLPTLGNININCEQLDSSCSYGGSGGRHHFGGILDSPPVLHHEALNAQLQQHAHAHALLPVLMPLSPPPTLPTSTLALPPTHDHDDIDLSLNDNMMGLHSYSSMMMMHVGNAAESSSSSSHNNNDDDDDSSNHPLLSPISPEWGNTSIPPMMSPPPPPPRNDNLDVFCLLSEAPSSSSHYQQQSQPPSRPILSLLDIPHTSTLSLPDTPPSSEGEGETNLRLSLSPGSFWDNEEPFGYEREQSSSSSSSSSSGSSSSSSSSETLSSPMDIWEDLPLSPQSCCSHSPHSPVSPSKPNTMDIISHQHYHHHLHEIPPHHFHDLHDFNHFDDDNDYHHHFSPHRRLSELDLDLGLDIHNIDAAHITSPSPSPSPSPLHPHSPASLRFGSSLPPSEIDEDDDGMMMESLDLSILSPPSSPSRNTVLSLPPAALGSSAGTEDMSMDELDLFELHDSQPPPPPPPPPAESSSRGVKRSLLLLDDPSDSVSPPRSPSPSDNDNFSIDPSLLSSSSSSNAAAAAAIEDPEFAALCELKRRTQAREKAARSREACLLEDAAEHGSGVGGVGGTGGGGVVSLQDAAEARRAVKREKGKGREVTALLRLKMDQRAAASASTTTTTTTTPSESTPPETLHGIQNSPPKKPKYAKKPRMTSIDQLVANMFFSRHEAPSSSSLSSPSSILKRKQREQVPVWVLREQGLPKSPLSKVVSLEDADSGEGEGKGEDEGGVASTSSWLDHPPPFAFVGGDDMMMMAVDGDGDEAGLLSPL